jgi:hypothetical protein
VENVVTTERTEKKQEIKLRGERKFLIVFLADADVVRYPQERAGRTPFHTRIMKGRKVRAGGHRHE